MKNKTKMINILFTRLKMIIVVFFVLDVILILSCCEEPDDPKPVQCSENITIAAGKTFAVNFTALPNTTPAWWSKLSSKLQQLESGFPAGNYTLTVTPSGTGGFVAGTSGSKTATVGESWLNNATDDQMMMSLAGMVGTWTAMNKNQNRIQYAGGMSYFELAQVKKHNDIV